MVNQRGELSYYIIIKCLCDKDDTRNMAQIITEFVKKLKIIARKQKAEVAVNPEIIEQKKKSLITYIISCTGKNVIEQSNPKKYLSDKYDNIKVTFKNLV